MSAKLNHFALLALILVSPLFLTTSALGYQASDEPNVSFDQMWIDYNGVLKNEFGMIIHVNLTVRQLRDIPSTLAVAMELGNGDRVNAITPEYASTNGQLTVYRKLAAKFDNSVYNDVQVFIPYREIAVGARSQTLRLHVDVLYENGGNLHLTYYDITTVFASPEKFGE